MRPYSISQNALARRIGVPPRRMEPFRAMGIAVPMRGPDGRDLETGYDEGRYDRFEVVRQ